jgi:hypothetical protein
MLISSSFLQKECVMTLFCIRLPLRAVKLAVLATIVAIVTTATLVASKPMPDQGFWTLPADHPAMVAERAEREALAREVGANFRACTYVGCKEGKFLCSSSAVTTKVYGKTGDGVPELRQTLDHGNLRLFAFSADKQFLRDRAGNDMFFTNDGWKTLRR